MTRLFIPIAVVAFVVGFLLIGCTQAAPEPTKAPPAPTKAAAAPSKAVETTRPIEATKATAGPTQATQPAATPVAAVPRKPADWPKRPVTLIVPWDPGGPVDFAFRLLAPKMEKYLETPVQVLNKPGAGTQIGTADVAMARPDGYTIGNIMAPHAMTIYLDPERKANFTWEDFAPIGTAMLDANVVTVLSDSKYKTFKDMVDDAKANPEKIKMGVGSVLGDDHLAILQVERALGIKFAQVFFSAGTAPQDVAMLGGHIDAGVANVANHAKPHKDGQMRVLLVMDDRRSKFLPDTPTTAELGISVTSYSLRALAAPKGTPKEIVDYLSYAMKEGMEDPDFKKKMEDSLIDQRYMSPAELDKFWRELEARIKPILALELQSRTQK